MTQAYLALEKVFKDIDIIRQAQSILGWDANTLMPEGSSESRGEQLAMLSKLAHQRLVSVGNCIFIKPSSGQC
jgi:carboxypeptidase Taq